MSTKMWPFAWHHNRGITINVYICDKNQVDTEILSIMQDLKLLKENDIEAYEIIIKLIQKLREIG